MKFNKLAKELDLPVGDLADKVKDILPNANGGTEVSEKQKTQIIARLQTPKPDSSRSLIAEDSTDPILSILFERIEQEQQIETPEQIVDRMIARYLENPEDLPADSNYRSAIVTYVDLVKKRHARRQQQSLKLRSLLNKQGSSGLASAEPLALETFYSAEPENAERSGQLGSSSSSPQLAAASS